MPTPTHSVQSLKWRDPPAGEISLPGDVLRLTLSVGSGLSFAGGRLWGLGDRGPNLKSGLATGRYGLTHLARLADVSGAKIMPDLAIGPTITELILGPDRVTAGAVLRLKTPTGRAVPGLPLPGGDSADMEPAFDLEGRRLAPDPDGMDTEGLAALPDGTFWVAEEYGPSLVQVDADGVCRRRLVPAGTTLPGAEIPTFDTLPALGARRKLNRGFEALAVSPDGSRLFVTFQSALEIGRRTARHARLWVVNPATGQVIAQHLYPFDTPASFHRDRAGGEDLVPGDLKLCDLAALDDRTLIVQERISKTTRLYRVTLGEPLPPAHLDIATRPALEEMGSGELSRRGLQRLAKTIILDTDEDESIARDIEGVALVAPDTLILATDNDYGIEGAETRVYRVTFERSLETS